MFRRVKLKKSVRMCGRNLKVFGRVYVTNGKGISIGDDCRMNDGCKLFGRFGSQIIIGNDVTLSPNVVVLSSGYDVKKWMNTQKKEHKSMNTYIGNHIWICTNSVVLGGVSITGEYVVIAAGSVVTSDINESYCVYAGVPARLVKKYR